MVVAFEACLDHCGEVAALPPRLVYGNAERSQPGQVHKQVVHKVAEASAVMPPEYSPEGNAILSAERMVAYESVEAAVAVVGHVLLANNVELRAKVFEAGLKPRHTLQVAVLPKEVVDLVLMQDAFEPSHDKARHILSLGTHLAAENSPYVNGFFGNLVHALSTNTMQK